MMTSSSSGGSGVGSGSSEAEGVILDRLLPKLQNSLSVSELRPHLKSAGLLTDSEYEQLEVGPNNPTREAVGKLVMLLKRKSSLSAARFLHQALKQSLMVASPHYGHFELLTLLEQELKARQEEHQQQRCLNGSHLLEANVDHSQTDGFKEGHSFSREDSINGYSYIPTDPSSFQQEKEYGLSNEPQHLLKYEHLLSSSSGKNRKEIEKLTCRLVQESKKIKQLFVDFVLDVCCLLESKEDVTAEKVKLSLQYMGCFRNDPGTQLVFNNRTPIGKAKDISELFGALHQFSSWFNYDIIAYLARRFGESRGKLMLERYESSLQKYFRRLVFECPPFSAHKSIEMSDGFEELEVKVDWNYHRCSIQDIAIFKITLSKILELQPELFLLKTVEEGCVRMTWAVPAITVPHVLCVAASKAHLLANEKVLSLRVGAKYIHVPPRKLNELLTSPPSAQQANNVSSAYDNEFSPRSSESTLTEASSGIGAGAGAGAGAGTARPLANNFVRNNVTDASQQKEKPKLRRNTWNLRSLLPSWKKKKNASCKLTISERRTNSKPPPLQLNPYSQPVPKTPTVGCLGITLAVSKRYAVTSPSSYVQFYYDEKRALKPSSLCGRSRSNVPVLDLANEPVAPSQTDSSTLYAEVRGSHDRQRQFGFTKGTFPEEETSPVLTKKSNPVSSLCDDGDEWLPKCSSKLVTPPSSMTDNSTSAGISSVSFSVEEYAAAVKERTPLDAHVPPALVPSEPPASKVTSPCKVVTDESVVRRLGDKKGRRVVCETEQTDITRSSDCRSSNIMLAAASEVQKRRNRRGGHRHVPETTSAQKTTQTATRAVTNSSVIKKSISFVTPIKERVFSPTPVQLSQPMGTSPADLPGMEASAPSHVSFLWRVLGRASKKYPADIHVLSIHPTHPVYDGDLKLRRGQSAKALFRLGDSVIAETSSGKTGFLPYNFCRISLKNYGPTSKIVKLSYCHLYVESADGIDTSVSDPDTEDPPIDMIAIQTQERSGSLEDMAVQSGERLRVLYCDDSWVYGISQNGSVGFLPRASCRLTKPASRLFREWVITTAPFQADFVVRFDEPPPPILCGKKSSSASSSSSSPSSSSSSANTVCERGKTVMITHNYDPIEDNSRTLRRGMKVKVLDTSKEMLLVRTKSGTSFWVPACFCGAPRPVNNHRMTQSPSFPISSSPSVELSQKNAQLSVMAAAKLLRRKKVSPSPQPNSSWCSSGAEDSPFVARESFTRDSHVRSRSIVSTRSSGYYSGHTAQSYSVKAKRNSNFSVFESPPSESVI